MKRLVAHLAVAGAILAAAQGAKADGTAEGSIKDAPVVAARTWSGLSIAGGLGYGMWSADTTTINPVTGACILCTTQTQGGNGMFGTLALGYDRQLNERYVAGVFVDYDFGKIEGTIQDQGPFFAGRIKNDRNFALGARAGRLVSPEALAYLTVGYTNAHFSRADMVQTFASTPTPFSTPGFAKGGWFIGGGFETALRDRWFLKTEYRLAHIGNETLVDSAEAKPTASITFKPVEQSVRSSLVYKFDWAR
jgi:outer membrane immunogenic protein